MESTATQDRWANWEQEQAARLKARLDFEALVYKLKEAGVPFTQMASAPEIKDAYSRSKGGEYNWNPSTSILAKAYSAHCDLLGADRDGPTNMVPSVRDEAIAFLLAAGWPRRKVAQAFGKSLSQFK